MSSSLRRRFFHVTLLGATALAAAAGTGCDLRRPKSPEMREALTAAGLDRAYSRVNPANCSVTGSVLDKNSLHTTLAYDFKYGQIIFDHNQNAQFSLAFSATTNPAVKAEVMAAYRLLPATCAAPVFAKSS